MDPRDYQTWRGSGIAGTVQAFWSAVKAVMYPHGVKKVFITGITPLQLSDMGSGFNIARNISFEPRFATVCGLTTDDVEDTLRLFCKGDEEKVKKHLTELQKYANGYHFSNKESVPKVFNPDTVMWYLDVISLTAYFEPGADYFSAPARGEAERPPLSMLRIPKSPRTS